MALARVKTWIAGEILTAADLNSEFNNILNNGPSLILPFTGAVDLDGQTMIMDSAAVTNVNSTGRTAFNFTPGGKTGTPNTTGSVSNWAAHTFTDSNTAGSGTAAAFAGVAFHQPTLVATNASVTTTDAATVYIAGAPIASTNETITDAYSLWVDAGRVRFDGAVDFAAVVTVASATEALVGAAASNNVDISGTTTIAGFDTVREGVIREGRFTGILQLTHNGTTFILPGAANITTAVDDRYKALSLGSGNWLFLDYTRANGTSTVDGGLPSGTVMLFFQAAAPTGWTQSATNNDYGLRVVSGTGGGTGGTVAFETAFASHTPAASGGVTGSHTLVESEIPAHTHTMPTDVDIGSTVVVAPATTTAVGSTLITNSTGGDGGHTHTFTGVAIDLDVQYMNVIHCSKD